MIYSLIVEAEEVKTKLEVLLCSVCLGADVSTFTRMHAQERDQYQDWQCQSLAHNHEDRAKRREHLDVLRTISQTKREPRSPVGIEVPCNIDCAHSCSEHDDYGCLWNHCSCEEMGERK